MPSREQVELFRAGQEEVARQAKAELEAFWATLPKGDAVFIRQELEQFLPALVDTYGEVAATIAADWYELLMNQSAAFPPLPPMGKVQASTRWAMTPSFARQNDQQSLNNLLLVTDELVKQFGRDTVMRSAGNNRVRFARVPLGDTCSWCIMLASRGYVYATESRAGQMVKFHGDCDCQVVPSDGIEVAGYDPDALYEIYSDAGGASNMKKTLANMRKELGSN